MTAVLLMLAHLLRAAGVPVAWVEDQPIVAAPPGANYKGPAPEGTPQPAPGVSDDPVAISNGF